jgi:hypothetical protein
MGRNITLIVLRAAPFTRRSNAVRTTVASTMLLLMLCVTPPRASELKQETLQAWDAYVQTVNLAMEERAAGRNTFLWVDESPDRRRRVRGGEMLVECYGPNKVPHGLIHHVVGALYLPGVTVDHVGWVLSDFDRYQDFYRLLVVKSKVLERTEDHEEVSLLMIQKAFGVTAAVETDDDVHIKKVDASRVYSLSNSVRVQEIADYGQSSEHPFPEDRRPGYVCNS